MWPSGRDKFKAKQVLMNSYILPDFGYCPLVSIFCLIKCANIIESLQKKGSHSLPYDTTNSENCNNLKL